MQNVSQGQFLSGVQLVWIQFSFFSTACVIKTTEPSLFHYLPTDGNESDRFMPFPRILAQKETPTDSSKIWTRITHCISYNDDFYAKRAFPTPVCVVCLWAEVAIAFQLLSWHELINIMNLSRALNLTTRWYFVAGLHIGYLPLWLLFLGILEGSSL